MTRILDVTTALSGRVELFMGYLLESDISTRSGDTLTYSNGTTSYEGTMVQVMAFSGVNQANPLAGSSIDESGVNDYNDTSATTASLTWAQYDMPAYTA